MLFVSRLQKFWAVRKDTENKRTITIKEEKTKFFLFADDNTIRTNPKESAKNQKRNESGQGLAVTYTSLSSLMGELKVTTEPAE